MQNQAAVEALYSATLVEDYIDIVENLPNELQRHLSELRELDLRLHREFLRDLDGLVANLEKETTVAGQRQILAKIHKGLVAAQDIGDEKLKVVQAISDLVESKNRLLEHDVKNLDFVDEEEDGEECGGGEEDEEEEENEAHVSAHGSSNGGGGSAAAVAAEGLHGTSKQTGGGNSKSTKRASDGRADKNIKRRKKQQASERFGNNDEENDSGATSATSKSGGSKARPSKRPVAKKRQQGGGGGGGSARKGGNDGKDDSDKEIDLSNFEIDPDEPTYCLCDQVSYGDMIGCDNDLCPIEWFHFSCVSLSNKPKGKWYCPKCRGDKQTVMKPKGQFLKELEKYNKEREEKMAKQNS